jgi:hypothetical protein
LREYINTNLATSRIRASLSPTGTSILFIVKSNGSIRLYIDYRELNKITIKNRYSLPLLVEILDRLRGVYIFTKLDLRDVYYRISIVKEDI